MSSTSSARQQPSAQQVKVSILLSGGHRYTLNMQANDPTLRSLVGSVISYSHGNGSEVKGLFQIPVEQNRASLCFPSSHLVGIVTEPPMILQLEDTPDSEEDASEAGTKPLGTSQAIAKPQDLEWSASYLQIEAFLSPTEHQQLLQYSIEHESSFATTTTMTSAAEHRRSRALYQFPDFSEQIRERIRTCLPDVLSKLRLEPFAPDTIEAQLTTHNDGDYYKIHNDGGGTPQTLTRVLTYVYYFHREPKPFGGGELLIYDTKIENNAYVKSGGYKVVEPRNNSIVFFPSRCLHEVLPIRCPSEAFADSRFTVNGWVRRQAG
ncbi:MAG: proline hydroxylase [Leptolyngbyaceae cyanobacterium SL_1_1]|nr:proline hydroxylase [Leptolyngbyaceae cyanobacterium RM1_1_2]NJO10200.1 proline hydroxylase [Leptolyngbyaceae cyanobacterium SL_1_1]